MTVIVTGGKYAAASLSSVGTTLVTTTTSPFGVNDFGVSRLVGLWNSTGTIFKGMAWVRRRVAANQLQLQTEFFDPSTGIAVTQVAGDTAISGSITMAVTAVTGTIYLYSQFSGRGITQLSTYIRQYYL